MQFFLLGFQIRQSQLAIAFPRNFQRYGKTFSNVTEPSYKPPCSHPPQDFHDGNREGEGEDDGTMQQHEKPVNHPSSSHSKGCSNDFLHSLCKEGHLDPALHALLRLRSSPPMQVYMSLLKACIKQRSLTHAYHIYAHVAQHRPHPTGLLGDYLVGTLARCGAVKEARHVSLRLPHRTVFSWTAMISSCADYGHEQEALVLHRCMQKEGVEPNQHTFASLFKACASIPATQEGKELHHLAQKKGFTSDAFVGTALVNMYSKFGDIVEAEGVFGKMVQRDIISWTAMLTAYVDHGQGEKALQLYRQMQAEGIIPDDRVFVISIQACGILAEKEEASFVEGQAIKVTSLNIGQALHADARKNGYASNVYVGTTLVSVYGKCGAISEAEDAFSILSQRNIVTWNAMLSAYVEQRLGERALHLYWVMQKEHVAFDDITLICVLQACCETGSLEACKQIHFHIASVEYDQNHSVVSTLIHGYGSCGGMVDAESIFFGLLAADIVSWSACIAGHAGEGNFSASIGVFEKMQLAGVQPNEVTFSSVLATCSHAGLVMEGLGFFKFIVQETSLVPDLKHYNSMIDLLGRAGNFKGLKNMLGMMPMQGDLTFWLCLLSVCRIHGNVELAKQAFDHAVDLQPNYPAAYILLSNIYADAGLQECAAQVKSSMRMLGLEEAWQELE